MKEIKAPNKFEKENSKKYIFLAGSIEMGAAEKWQEKLINEFIKEDNAVFLNPRRNDWNSSWKQDKENQNFREQVEWELNAMEVADLIVMYFVPGTISPISLLEFGMWCKTNKIIVYCPEGFQRKGNVDIVCERYGTKQVSNWNEFINAIHNFLKDN
jgi:hypothetical protein